MSDEARDRAVYLLGVVSRYFAQNPIAAEYNVEYDDATCDGTCLAEDCRIAAEQLQMTGRGIA